MTNKEIDKLAELIADKLIAKQKEYDEQFHVDLQETISDKLGNVRHVSEEELYQAYRKQKGFIFMLSCIPLHYFIILVMSFGFISGTINYLFNHADK